MMNALVHGLSGFIRGRWGMSSSVDMLRQRQATRLMSHFEYLRVNSPYYKDLFSRMWHPHDAFETLKQLPIIEKAQWLSMFDLTNTANLRAQDVIHVARNAEKDRDFSPTCNGYTVGLSSGTTGSRGFFVVSPMEQARWSGFILSQMLPRSIFHRERVAFFLRANSRLYESVSTPTLNFEFFDLLRPYSELEHRLREYQPTMIVAPSQVLRRILLYAYAYPNLHSVINVAEVFDVQTKHMIQRLGLHAAEVYQATEGLLATTCPYGMLHLNEEHVVVEREYIDEHRFVPIITDMYRRIQPLIRFRLNDVLCASSTKCPCGRPHAAIAHIDGRQDDQLVFGDRLIFADGLSRVVANTLPLTSQYEIVQDGRSLILRTEADIESGFKLRQAVEDFLHIQGVHKHEYDILLRPSSNFLVEDDQAHIKRRRIRRIR